MEHINEEGWDLIDLEDVPKSDQRKDSVEQTGIVDTKQL